MHKAARCGSRSVNSLHCMQTVILLILTECRNEGEGEDNPEQVSA